MKALILAAGYATRLYPLTKDYPKPLLKVKDKPIIDYIVDKIDAIKEIDEIIVVTNSKFFPHFMEWKNSRNLGKALTIVDDLTQSNAARLGAVGDICFALEKKKIKDDLLVVGGDNIFDAGLGNFLDFAKAKNPYPAIGIFDIKAKSKAKKYGVVKLDKTKRITDFQEKPKEPDSTLVAMCLYYFPKDKLKLVKEYLEQKDKSSDASGSYIDWLKRMAPVYGFKFGGHWYDIGDMKFYGEAKAKFINQ